MASQSCFHQIFTAPGPREDIRLHLRGGVGLDGALCAGRTCKMGSHGQPKAIVEMYIYIYVAILNDGVLC